MSVADLDKQIAELQAQRATAVKEEKKAAIAQVKDMIKTYGITTGDLRGSLYKSFDKKGKGVKAQGLLLYLFVNRLAQHNRSITYLAHIVSIKTMS